MTGENNGPMQADGVTPIGGGITTQNTGAQPQRARLRAAKAPAGLLSQPTRTVRVAVRSLCTPQAPVNDAQGNPILTALDTCLNNAPTFANGLRAGEYTAPDLRVHLPGERQTRGLADPLRSLAPALHSQRRRSNDRISRSVRASAHSNRLPGNDCPAIPARQGG